MRKPSPGPYHWRTFAKRGFHGGLICLVRLPALFRHFAVLDRRLRGDHASYRLVMSLADAGHLALALRYAEAVIPAALRAYRPRPALAPSTRAHKTSDSAHEAMLTICLDDALSALTTLHNARPFLAYGTLLGMARNGGFLPADPDIDLGVFYPDLTPDQVECALLATGFHLSRRANPTWPGVTQAIHPRGGGLDVVYFKRQDNALITHSMLFGHRVTRRRPAFDLAPAKFVGRTVAVPSPPDRFLTPNYGDWRKRPVYYHNLLSPDLPVEESTNPALDLLARAELIRLLHARNLAPLKHFLDLVQQRLPHDPLWPQIAGQLHVSCS